ncbi:MAG: hypothetical protein IJU91_07010 [Selenomonadaceae bacterium]|nr:hypothetical protein [Selenomonadaceae bacterium]
MTPYEGVLSCYFLAIKILKSSFYEVDEMELDILLELINVYDKINSAESKSEVFIDDIL